MSLSGALSHLTVKGSQPPVPTGTVVASPVAVIQPAAAAPEKQQQEEPPPQKKFARFPRLLLLLPDTTPSRPQKEERRIEVGGNDPRGRQGEQSGCRTTPTETEKTARHRRQRRICGSGSTTASNASSASRSSPNNVAEGSSAPRRNRFPTAAATAAAEPATSRNDAGSARSHQKTNDDREGVQRARREAPGEAAGGPFSPPDRTTETGRTLPWSVSRRHLRLCVPALRRHIRDGPALCPSSGTSGSHRRRTNGPASAAR